MYWNSTMNSLLVRATCKGWRYRWDIVLALYNPCQKIGWDETRNIIEILFFKILRKECSPLWKIWHEPWRIGIHSLCRNLWASNSEKWANRSNGWQWAEAVCYKEKLVFCSFGRLDKSKVSRRVPWTEVCCQGQIFKKSCWYSPSIFIL